MLRDTYIFVLIFFLSSYNLKYHPYIKNKAFQLLGNEIAWKFPIMFNREMGIW